MGLLGDGGGGRRAAGEAGKWAGVRQILDISAEPPKGVRVQPGPRWESAATSEVASLVRSADVAQIKPSVK